MAVSRFGFQIVCKAAERPIGLPMVRTRPIKHQEMGVILPIVGDECFDAAPGTVGRGEIKPSIDVATWRRWTNNVKRY